MRKMMPPLSFWQKVDRNGPIPDHLPELGPCWVWTGYKLKKSGYGRIHLFKGAGGHPYVHDLAYEMLIGPIPDDLEPDHLCRNRACVKAIANEQGPSHLELVTPKVNCERGETGQHNARKTYCPQGYPYNEANTYPDKKGTRHCRVCNRERKRTAILLNEENA